MRNSYLNVFTSRAIVATLVASSVPVAAQPSAVPSAAAPPAAAQVPAAGAAAPVPAAAPDQAATPAATTGVPSDSPPAPSGPTAGDCVEHFEGGQTRQANNDLLAAKADFLACSQSACPSVIVNECIARVEALKSRIPALGFRIVNKRGEELFDVVVNLDGKLLTEQLNGSSYEVNPGVHQLDVIAKDYVTAKETVSVLAGETGKVVEIVLSHTDPSLDPKPKEASGGVQQIIVRGPETKPLVIPTMSYVSAGVGVLGLGAFGFFRVTGQADYDDLDTKGCGRFQACTADDTDPIKQKFLFSNIGLGVGAAGIVGAIIIVAAGQPDDEPPASPQVGLSVWPAGDGASVNWMF